MEGRIDWGDTGGREIPLGVCCSSAGEFRMVAVQWKDWGNIGNLGVFVLEECGR